MRETKDRVMLFFCEKTNRKIENLDTKTTILKNLSIRNAGMAQILQEGASLKIFHKKQLKKFNRSTKKPEIRVEEWEVSWSVHRM